MRAEGSPSARRSGRKAELGSGQFEVCLVDETSIGKPTAARPTVKGTAGLLGFAKRLLDARDPVSSGFVIR